MATLPTGSLELTGMALAEADLAFRQVEPEALTDTVQRASHLAVVSFFKEDNEQESARNLVGGLLQNGFQFLGISLLITTRQLDNNYSPADTRRSHVCTNALANAALSLAAPAEVLPIYKERLKIDSWVPYGSAGRETPEGLDRYGLSERDIRTSEAASRAYRHFLDPLMKRSSEGVAEGIDLLRGHRSTGLIVITSDYDAASFTVSAGQREHTETAQIPGATLITDLSRLQIVA